MGAGPGRGRGRPRPPPATNIGTAGANLAQHRPDSRQAGALASSTSNRDFFIVLLIIILSPVMDRKRVTMVVLLIIIFEPRDGPQEGDHGRGCRWDMLQISETWRPGTVSPGP